jgi:hypothetical protein
MTGHPEGCLCTQWCDPVFCADCGMRNPPMMLHGRCTHRRACEARQMLKAGARPEIAAAHAQRLPNPSERQGS